MMTLLQPLIILCVAFIAVRSSGVQPVQHNCGSPYNISAISWDYPPYTHRNSKHSIMHLLVEAMVTKCCHPNTGIIFQKGKIVGNEIMKDLRNNVTFAFPISRNIHDHQAHIEIPGHKLLPVIISPGAVFIERQLPGGYILDILMQMWPLLIVMVIATGFAGIIMWALDHKENGDNFQRPFLRGFPDGIWWAFVSMTTVGYGDKTPVTPMGRVFGMLWILIGISIIAIFQSSVTTALSFIQQPRQDIYNKHVVVIRGTEDFTLAVSEGANVEECMNADCLLERMESDEIDGIVVDYFVEKHARQWSAADNDFVVAYTLETPVIHGIFVQGFTNEIETCFASVIENEHIQVYKWLHAMSNFRIAKTKYSTVGDVAYDILYTDDTEVIIYGTCTGCLVIIIIILAIWDLRIWRPRQAERRHTLRRAQTATGVHNTGCDARLRMKCDQVQVMCEDKQPYGENNINMIKY